ncbi:MAG: lysylphosphatidylglycerol synthase domain-containing protein, partial [Candidatus Anammoxibacter sp.]
MAMINKIIKALKSKKILLILKVSISFSILYWILTNISFTDIGVSLRSAKIGFVLIATLIMIPMRYIAAYQMKLLTSHQGLSLSTNKVFEINFIASFYGLFLPSGISGGVIKWHKFS